MKNSVIFRVVLFLGVLFVHIGCATSPTGRKQLILVPDSQMDEMGVQAFQQIKGKEKREKAHGANQFVDCVVQPLIHAAQSLEGAHPGSWEVVVFQSDQANAFALPGGKIGIYTGLLKVAETDAQLAAVVGHEIGHVLARHGAERVSQHMGTQVGLAAASIAAGKSRESQQLVGLLGVGAQVGILLPFSRTQESEADLIGLEIMARAGFDPEQSVELWKNMKRNSGGKAPPEFLSTHPASDTRIRNLAEHLPRVRPAYQQSRKVQCTR